MTIEPCDDHAVVMASFARDCLNRFARLVQTLERTLGPETGKLKIRFGLHSGPVTGGILRGDKVRAIQPFV
jgi:class 3 adenylate cyclase